MKLADMEPGKMYAFEDIEPEEVTIVIEGARSMRVLLFPGGGYLEVIDAPVSR